MSIVKLNNRSVKDITQFGSITSLGSLTHIATQTASSSANITFTSGIDSTYKGYIFYLVDIHPETDNSSFTFQVSTDGGSSYGVTATTTYFRGQQQEGGSGASLTYITADDAAQSTNFLVLSEDCGNDNDQAVSGVLKIFNPSGTTHVKHFQSHFSGSQFNNYSFNEFVAGYFNDTSAINAVKFSFGAGDIDSGQILLFGLN
tara:strand:- start:10 stop:615 length:606 start_codon:yes stop_codon:yes gene_type:complete